MSKTVDRIRSLLAEKNISIRGLGVMTGIPTATMSRYIGTETQRIPVDKLLLIANALNTTPTYLMGWDESDESNDMLLSDGERLIIERYSPTESNLSEGEQKLVELFRSVPKEQQELVLSMIEAALKKM